MHISQLEPFEEVFTWYDPDKGCAVSFAVAQLNRLVHAVLPPSHTLAYPDNFDQFLLEQRGVDVARAMALTGDQLAQPCTVLVMEGHTLLADGTHRSFRRYREGRRDGPCFLIPQSVWECYVITGINNDMTEDRVLDLPTSMLAHRRKQ